MGRLFILGNPLRVLDMKHTRACTLNRAGKPEIPKVYIASNHYAASLIPRP